MIKYACFLLSIKSEYRSWLLYYGIPCLQGILPTMYLRNFALLAEGMHLLLAAKISVEMVRRAEVVLNDFYYEAQDIYGKLAYKFIF